MKELYLIRHAKSSWADESLRDIERPLNDRGERDAPKMAEHFAKEVGSVNMLISSPAVRAFTTCKHFAKALHYPKGAIIINENIYGASVGSMMAIINDLDDQWDKVVLFGHNPTFTYLAEQLCSINIGNLPTCGMVGIRFEVEQWEAVSLDSGTNILYDYPKNHR